MSALFAVVFACAAFGLFAWSPIGAFGLVLAAVVSTYYSVGSASSGPRRWVKIGLISIATLIAGWMVLLFLLVLLAPAI